MNKAKLGRGKRPRGIRRDLVETAQLAATPPLRELRTLQGH